MTETRNNGRRSTRERILGTALELFLELGVEGTTVSAIERGVGLAAGTGSFYRHFRSKEEVLTASFRHRLDELIAESAAIRAVLPPIDNPTERLSLEYRVRLAEMRRFEPLWRLVITERHRHPELRRLFIEAVRPGTWELTTHADPKHLLANAALAGYHQMSLLEEGPSRHVDPDEFIAALVQATVDLDTEPRSQRSQRKQQPPDGGRRLS